MSARDGRSRGRDSASLFALPWSKTEWAPLPAVAPTVPVAKPASRTETARGEAQGTPTVSAPVPARRERQRAREERQRRKRMASNALAVGGIVTDPEVLYDIARRVCFQPPKHDLDHATGGVQAGLDAAERASGGNMPPGRWFEERLTREWNDVHTRRDKRRRERENTAKPLEATPPSARLIDRVYRAVRDALHARDPKVFTCPPKATREYWFKVALAQGASGAKRAVRVSPPGPRKVRGVSVHVVVSTRILPAIASGTAWGPGWLLLDIEPDGTRVVARQRGDRTFTIHKDTP